MKKFALFAVLLSSLAFGQRAGVSSFGAADTFANDTVDLQSLTTTINIPILGKSVGPLPGSISLTSPQYCVSAPSGMSTTTQCGDGSMLFIPDPMMDLTVAWTATQNTNPGCTTDWIFSVTGLIGGDGLSFYPIAGATVHSISSCGSVTATVITDDGTGITAVVDGSTGGGNPLVVVTSATNTSGWNTNPHLGSNLTDPFSNAITNPGAFSGTFTDSLGAQTTLGPQITGLGMPTYYQYTDTTGTTQKVNINAGTAQSYHNNVCGSANPSTVVPLSSISYPDGTEFSFTYDSMQTGTIDGLIKSFTNREGGTVTYTYGTITTDCAGDWAYASLSRQDSDGTTSYTRSYSSGTTTTTVLDPGKNKIVYTIGYPNTARAASFVTSVDRYQNTGTVASPTYSEVSKTSYCYNNNCSAAPTYPITQRDTYQYTYNGATQVQMSHRVELYDSTYGLVTSDANTDSINSQTITTTYAYGSWNGSSCSTITNIHDHVCTVTTKNGTTQLAYETFAYNSNGAMTASTEWVSSTDTLTTSYTRNSTGTPATITLPNSQVITNTFGSCNSLMLTDSTTTVNSVAIDNKATWNCNAGVVTDTTDPNSNEDDYVYDSMNRISSYTDRLENVTSYAYGTPTLDHVKITDPLSVVTYQYNDGLGRPTNTQICQTTGCSNLDTSSVAYAWNGVNFETTTYVPCTKTTLNSACTTVALTADSNPVFGPVKTTDANSGTLTWARNSKDFSLTAGPAPTQENTKVLQTEVDGFGRTTSTCALTSSGYNGRVSCGQTMGNSGTLTSNTYSFDATTGAPKVVTTRGSQTHTTITDSLGRVTSIASPEAGTVTGTYDSLAANTCGSNSAQSAAGYLVATTDAATNHVCRHYEGLGRVTEIWSNVESTTNPCELYAYDATANGYVTAPTGYPTSGNNILGRLVEAATFPGACTGSPLTDEWFAYDKVGRITDMWEATPSHTSYIHTTVTFDADGTPTQLSGIPNGSTITWGVDGEDRWNSMTYGTTTVVSATAGNGFTYDAASRPTNVPTGTSGDQDTYTFDNVGNMTDFKFSVNSKTFEGALTLNSIGSLNKLVITDGFNSGGTQTCTYGTSTVEGYDDVGRLLDANCGSLIQHDSWTYDQYDNATRTGNPGTSWNPGYSSTTNEMTGSTYDSNGNVTYDGNSSYSWNVYGKMVGTVSGNHTVSCGTASNYCATYDAFNRLAESSQGTQNFPIILTPIGPIGVMSGANFFRLNAPAPGGGQFYANTGSNFVSHPDGLGSMRLRTDLSARTAALDTAYTPYGELYNTFGTLGAIEWDSGFTGDHEWINTGLFDTPNRELATNASRWLSPDPAHASWNAYSYPTDPNTQTDPSGLCDPGATCPTEPPCSTTNNQGPCSNFNPAPSTGTITDPPSTGTIVSFNVGNKPENLIGGPDPQTSYKYWVGQGLSGPVMGAVIPIGRMRWRWDLNLASKPFNPPNPFGIRPGVENPSTLASPESIARFYGDDAAPTAAEETLRQQAELERLRREMIAAQEQLEEIRQMLRGPQLVTTPPPPRGLGVGSILGGTISILQVTLPMNGSHQSWFGETSWGNSWQAIKATPVMLWNWLRSEPCPECNANQP